MKPILQATGDQLMAMLPNDPEGIFAKLKPKPAGSEEAVPDSDTEQKPPAPKPEGGNKT